MKKICKKLLILLTIIFFIIILSMGKTFAFSVTELTGTQLSNSEATGIGNSIITILTTVGVVISVIVLIVIGLKYMMGSLEEKAEYKKSLMPYVIGAVIVFAASTIAGVVYNLAGNI